MSETDWRERLIEVRQMRAGDVLPHPLNPKIHPPSQNEALTGLLDDVGKCDILKAYYSQREGGKLVFFDGHARQGLKPDEAWNVGIYDVTDDEADKLLLTFDPIAQEAQASQAKMEMLLHRTSSGNAAVMEFLAKQAEKHGIVPPNGIRSGDGDSAGESANLTAQPEEARKTLADRFLIPPFSVLDARQGYWQDRKRAWLALGIQSELGRGDGVTCPPSDAITEPGLNYYRNEKKNGLLGESEQARSHYKEKPSNLARCFGQDLMRGEHTVGETASLKGGLVHGTTIHPYDGSSSEVQSGTSIFDPVLCELAYRWFSPPDAAILDPFAGGSVRGIVASILGRNYTGIDLRAEQIAANEAQAKDITPTKLPRWITGDSRNAATLAAGEYDLVFSCPPYADLEVYSDNPLDLSTMSYGDFLKSYTEIIFQSVGMLKPNRFACFVVGDVRDKKGFYRNFVSDTISAFQASGARLYNEAILVTSVGSLPIRVGRQFESGRKLGKTHQNVLVFCKGDPKKAVADCGAVDVHDPAENFGEVVD